MMVHMSGSRLSLRQRPHSERWKRYDAHHHDDHHHDIRIYDDHGDHDHDLLRCGPRARSRRSASALLPRWSCRESSCSLAHGGLLTAARVATGKTRHEVVLSAPAMDTVDLSGKVVMITGASRGPRSALARCPCALLAAPLFALLRSCASPLLRSH